MSKKLSISFEFFPPQTAEGMEKLHLARKQLEPLKPEFFSVTFGAGGSTRDRTFETVKQIQDAGYPAAPHLFDSFKGAISCGTTGTKRYREKFRLEWL